jgi:hypothetical protein
MERHMRYVRQLRTKSSEGTIRNMNVRGGEENK